MKKFLVLSLSLVIGIVALTGCSGGGSSSVSSKKCQFKKDGKRICNDNCESGSNFCSYHTDYLDDAYNSIVGE